MSGQPLDPTVEVLSLQRAAEQDFGRAKMPVGDAALVRVRAWNGEAVGEEVDLLLNQKRCQATGRDLFTARSEEHTSELQSLMRSSYAVFCLKQKNIIITMHI